MIKVAQYKVTACCVVLFGYSERDNLIIGYINIIKTFRPSLCYPIVSTVKETGFIRIISLK